MSEDIGVRRPSLRNGRDPWCLQWGRYGGNAIGTIHLRLCAKYY